MDYRRDTRGMALRRKEREFGKTLKNIPNKIGPIGWLLVIVGMLCVCVAVYFGTNVISNPDVEALSTHVIDQSHVKHLVAAAAAEAESAAEETKVAVVGGTIQSDWKNLSGYSWGQYPLELYPLSVCGELGSSEKSILKCWGDAGQAYSLMQLDYRYDLVPFMKQAYDKNPVAWKGFAPFTNVPPASASLVSNAGIRDAFNFCYINYPEVYMEDMPNFFTARYLYSAGVKSRLDAAGIKLEEHSVYVSAALLSCNVNCGEITGTQNFIKAGATNDMSDEELLNCIYTGWRMYRSSGKWSKSGARLALDKSGEEGLALKFLRGEADPTTFNNTKTCSWGAGWDGANSVHISRKGS